MKTWVVLETYADNFTYTEIHSETAQPDTFAEFWAGEVQTPS